jgi:hypothetical protein
VYREVAVAGKPESVRLESYLRGKVRSVNMQNFVYLDAFADAGETVKTIGSLGVLLQSKRVGLIPAVGPLLSQILRSPFFLNKDLIKTVLELAGEDSNALSPETN